jgi:hypothetical protein
MSSEQVSWFRSRSGLVFLGFSAIAIFFLWEEHKAHLLGALPYCLAAALPAPAFVSWRTWATRGWGRAT